MTKKYYSVCDLQKKDIVSFASNKESINECIFPLRSWVANEVNITSINDSDFLRDWDFVVIEHEEVISEEMFTSINILNYKVVLPYNN